MEFANRDDHEQFDQREAIGVIYTGIAEISIAPFPRRLGMITAMPGERAWAFHK